MPVRLLVEVDMFSVSLLWIGKRKKTIFFDIDCHESHLMKCLHNNITQNDTIWRHMYLPHLDSNVKTTSNQRNT